MLMHIPPPHPQPNLHRIEDALPNGLVKEAAPGVAQLLPLSLFTGERTDFSLARLAHYTGAGTATAGPLLLACYCCIPLLLACYCWAAAAGLLLLFRYC